MYKYEQILVYLSCSKLSYCELNIYSLPRYPGHGPGRGFEALPTNHLEPDSSAVRSRRSLSLFSGRAAPVPQEAYGIAMEVGPCWIPPHRIARPQRRVLQCRERRKAARRALELLRPFATGDRAARPVPLRRRRIGIPGWLPPSTGANFRNPQVPFAAAVNRQVSAATVACGRRLRVTTTACAVVPQSGHLVNRPQARGGHIAAESVAEPGGMPSIRPASVIAGIAEPRETGLKSTGPSPDGITPRQP